VLPDLVPADLFKALLNFTGGSNGLFFKHLMELLHYSVDIIVPNVSFLYFYVAEHKLKTPTTSWLKKNRRGV
jgi:hypothetical protein